MPGSDAEDLDSRSDRVELVIGAVRERRSSETGIEDENRCAVVLQREKQLISIMYDERKNSKGGLKMKRRSYGRLERRSGMAWDNGDQ